MKKKIMIGLFGIVLMTSLVFAVGFGISKNASIDSDSKNIIDAINTDPLERGNITCDNLEGVLVGSESCSQRMWKGKYNLGEVKVGATKCKTYNETINEETGEIDGSCILYQALEDDKIIEEITKQQEKKLETIAKMITKRESKASGKKIVDAGEIILSAK